MPADGAPPPGLLAGAALLLDFDGTLVDIADRPEDVAPDPRLPSLLARLARLLDGRLALVSGRPAREVAALAGGQGIMVAGSHGLEFLLADGTIERPERPAALDMLGNEARALATRWPGVLVEDKPLGIALHYRLCAAAEPAVHAFANAVAARHGLHLQTGKMMVEVRTGGGDKGTALRWLVEAGPLAGGRPVFLGDDDTDEPALAAAQDLGGAGVLVGPVRPSAARFRLASPARVLAWLHAEAELLEAQA